jgi:hypothetical protein
MNQLKGAVMEASKHRVFYYHADASPFGGHITHPVETIVPSHGSSSLAQAGGHASSSMGPFRLDDIASCEGAHSKIFGTMHKATGSWTTMVTSVIEGLNVLEVVKADRVVSKVAVEHPRDGYHPKVTFVGSHFDNLRIAGVSINPTLHDNMFASPKNKFPNVPCTEDKAFIDRAISQSQKMIKAEGSPEWIRTRYGWIGSEKERRKKGYVVCSLVDQVGRARPGSSFGHIVHVPGFGNVFLGEVTVSHGQFRLTMIRIEMGCPAEGNLSIASAHSNGVTMP